MSRDCSSDDTAAPPADAAAASSSAATATASRKRPCHFHQGPDEAEEEQREEAAAAQPPVTRLYKHALESIFAFLSLADLSRVLSVARSWSSAVSSMRCTDAVVESLPAGRSLLTLSASRLARHIGTLGSLNNGIALSQESSHSAGLRMSGLKSLFYKLSPLPDAPLILPPSLTRLRIDVSSASAAEVDVAIAAASRLPSLASLELQLHLSQLSPLVSFAPLRCSALQNLGLLGWTTLTQAQADDLRALPHLTSLFHWLDRPKLQMLLRAPHPLQWQKLRVDGPLDAELTGLLVSLPLLSVLVVADCENVSFLQSLPNLHTLAFYKFAHRKPLPSPEQTIQGIGQCAQLTSLNMANSPLTSAHMSALLERMPALSKLKLANMTSLESLSFLSSEPLQRSLTSLTLADCHHATLLTVELRHIFALQQLTHLTIRGCFAERLCSFALHELKVPSARLPKLIQSDVIEVSS